VNILYNAERGKGKMPLQSIFDKSENLAKLKKCYLEDKMSTPDISASSEGLFGRHFGTASIYNALMRNCIPVRSKSESVSIATRTLNYDKSYLTEDVLEWIDGFLLGDGGIRFHNATFKKEKKLSYARFSIGSVQREWVEYAMSKLIAYSPRAITKTEYDNDPKNPNPLYSSRTLGHPDIVLQVKRWYPLPECKKIVPCDVRITPASVML